LRVQLQPAFILHNRHYRDSSQLLDILTVEYGRISLVARGARRSSRGCTPGAILQPFIPLLLSFSGRSELKSLTASEIAGEVPLLRGERLFSGIYLNELLVRLLHRNDAHPGLFIAYGEAVAALGESEGLDDILRRFEFRLLDELGYSFDLETDGHSGEPVSDDRWYHYHQEFGLVEQPGGTDPGSPVFSGEDLRAISRGDQSSSARQACKRLLRQALAGHLGDKPLKSRELFRRPTIPNTGRGEGR
jgi:DNA repair protein RecO (recombination protein O)